MSANRSVRTRLTLYFTLVFGIMVVCLAVGSYSVFRHQAYAELDNSLNVAASATAISAAHELDEHREQSDGEVDLQSILDISSRSALPKAQILIREGDRNVAHNAAQLPLDLSNISSLHLLANDIKGFRVSSSEISVPKFRSNYRIFAAGSVAPTLNSIRRFRNILFICIPLGLALAALAGNLLARRSLQPLNELTRTIEAITTSDLSARVKLENAPSDLAWLALRFNSLLDRLEKAFHFQRQFMADASHELRTPLTVALSATQVTVRDKSRTVADCDEALSLVEEQIHRLRGIVDNMLLLSQVDASSLHLDRRLLYLDDAISEAARGARALARTKHQILRIAELPEAECLGDESLLKQAILILLDNAVKYTPFNGEIFVSLTRDERNWRCRVWNSGAGISVDAQPHIFERFYRAARNTKGSGLGLSIARTIAETHQGEVILVASGPQGTTFDLILPAAEPVSHTVQAKSLAVSI